jgi:hypothetical protein
VSIREITNLETLIAEAREMQASGRYINGTVFHALADEIDRLRGALRSVIRTWEDPGPMGTMYEMPRAISFAKSVLDNRGGRP